MKPTAVTRASLQPLSIIKSTVKPNALATRTITKANIKKSSGAYVSDNTGAYKFDNRGTWKPDNRGTYDGSRFDSGKYRRRG